MRSVDAGRLDEAQDLPQKSPNRLGGQIGLLIFGYSRDADAKGGSEEERDCVTMPESLKSARHSTEKRLP